MRTATRLAAACLALSACARSPAPVPPVTPEPTAMHHAGKFVWYDLLAHDVEGAKRFYGELFGWQFTTDPEGDSLGRRGGAAALAGRRGGTAMSNLRLKLLLAAALLGLGAAGCGGGGNVYVGVGVVGPYWGYPYPVTTHPGVYGRPRYWDEDLEEDASLDGGAQRPRIERRGRLHPPGVALPP